MNSASIYWSPHIDWRRNTTHSSSATDRYVGTLRLGLRVSLSKTRVQAHLIKTLTIRQRASQHHCLKEIIATSNIAVTTFTCTRTMQHSVQCYAPHIQSNLVATDPYVTETSMSPKKARAVNLLTHLNLPEYNGYLAVTEAERSFGTSARTKFHYTQLNYICSSNDDLLKARVPL